jgi:hypothetical protein
MVLMKISLSPMRCEGSLEVSKAGDVLTINGESFNFTSLPEGATIPAGIVPCDWIAGPVERVDGAINVTLILPHGPNPSEAVAFPSTIENPPDGVIDLPREPSNVDA